MSCCAAAGVPFADLNAAPSRRDELLLASRRIDADLYQTDFAVADIHCGGCIRKIESALCNLSGVDRARVNLSTKKVMVQWRGEHDAPPIIETLSALGYAAHLYDATTLESDETLRELTRALAVAGFAAGNIMMLSVSVWSGAEPATRDLFHWISAAIALPALIYAGRIFFRSAWNAVRHGRTNMDVPISIGVLLAFGMSLYETAHQGQHAYFDAAISLLFFLLIGRTLDHVMRNRARTAVAGLARLASRGALVLRDGHPQYVRVEEIEPGMKLLLAAGERVPVDARVLSGQSDIDCSLVSGESAPCPAMSGTLLQAGTLNLTGPLTLVATTTAKDSFLTEMVRLMEAAKSGRSGYRGIADRAARLYAPVVHLTAFLTFVGWMIATGDLHRAVTIAIAVLIITCPCALGLAVPMVQVVAASRLFDSGIMIKDGSALERLAEVDSAVFDKTGTLTLGRPHLIEAETHAIEALQLASALGAHSRHPYARASAEASPPRRELSPSSIRELPGLGMEYTENASVYRLGRPDWALAQGTISSEAANANVVLSRNGACLAAFRFEDRLRSGARETLEALGQEGFGISMLSGDREATVKHLAGSLGIPYRAEMSPADKVKHIADLEKAGRKVLMVGDGLNDAPALAAAYVSIAPATGADVGRQAADLVFLHESLTAVPRALDTARRARHLIRQNLALSIGYNVIAVPVAIFGFVTPLIAAIAMSLSSVLVIANALRLRDGICRKTSNEPARSRIGPIVLFGSKPMSDFLFLVPLSIILGLAGLAAFMWTLRSGQYEDLEGAAERILFTEDDHPLR